MKISSKIHYLFLLVVISFNGNAQKIENAETLIVNEWVLNSFEVSGQTFPPKEKNKNDRMIFYSDKSVESYSSGRIQNGTWSYDKTSKMIKVIDEKNKFDMQLKLISITKLECVLELENPKETFVKLNMISKVK